MDAHAHTPWVSPCAGRPCCQYLQLWLKAFIQALSKANRTSHRTHVSGSNPQPAGSRRLLVKYQAPQSAWLCDPWPEKSLFTGSFSFLSHLLTPPTYVFWDGLHMNSLHSNSVSESVSGERQTKRPEKKRQSQRAGLSCHEGTKWHLATYPVNTSVTLVLWMYSSLSFLSRTWGREALGFFHSLLHAHHILKLNLNRVRYSSHHSSDFFLSTEPSTSSYTALGMG